VSIDVEDQSHNQVADRHDGQDLLCAHAVASEALVPEECSELVPAQSKLVLKSTDKSITDVVHSSTGS